MNQKKPPRHVVINADDFGICAATNQAILQAWSKGCLSSTSLLANGPAFEHAAELWSEMARPLGLGVHLNLCSGVPVADPAEITLLVDPQGRLAVSFRQAWSQSHNREFLRQVELEWDAQLQKIRRAGLPLDHLNSHRHYHMIPQLFRLASQLASRYQIAHVRVSCERESFLGQRVFSQAPFRLASNLLKQQVLKYLATRCKANSPDAVFGILDSGRVDRKAIERILAGSQASSIEILTHPGEPDAKLPRELDAADQAFLRQGTRRQELATLLDPELPKQLEQAGWTLARFADLPRYREVCPSSSNSFKPTDN